MQKYLQAAFLICVLFLSCNKDEDHKLLGPGIILSADVQPQYWYDLRDFLNSHGVKMTFYLQSYHLMDSAAKAKARVMIADGHEIAHHTVTHPHADEYLMSFPIDDYMENEIYSMDRLMQKDGFNTLNFAYPYGDFTGQSDEYLLKRFNSIRKIIGPYATKNIEDMDQIYYRYKGVKIIYACTIDRQRKYPVKEILAAMDKAKSSRSALSLYCHVVDKGKVEKPSVYSLDYNDLKQIIEYADKLGLTFYRAQDISR